MADAPSWHYPLGDEARWVTAWGLPTRRRPPDAPLDRLRWQRLLDDAATHELEGLLVAAVASDHLPTTADQMCDAGRIELALTRRRIEHERSATPVLELFDAAGIETRLLKGAAVARLDYSDEQLRPTNDVDLLVPADRIDQASALLVAAGGNRIDPDPTPGWTSLVGKGATVEMPDLNIEVDLHRILVWGPLGVRVPPDELWERSRPFDFAGVERRTLGREETLLHLCAHLLVLGVTRAREVRDVAQLAASKIDPDRVLHLARRWDQEALLATSIAMAGRELDLTERWCALSDWADAYRVGTLDALWLRAGAAQRRIRGIEQLGVLWELGRFENRRRTRRVLVRANLFPEPGTYARPLRRMVTLAGRGFGVLRPGRRGVDEVPE